MYISKKKFEEIKSKYSTLLILASDTVDAMNFVHDILEAEADAVKEREPYATTSISRLEQAAYEVFSVAGDIDNDCFGDGEG